MKGLSLIQPWATLIAIKAKAFETRSWRTHYRGLVAIHASKGFPKSARVLCFTEPFESVLCSGGYSHPPRHWYHHAQVDISKLPLGAIIAVAELVNIDTIKLDCTTGKAWLAPSEHFVEGDELAFGDYTPGRYAWLLSNVKKLTKPIPFSGQRGIWDVPAEVQAEIERRLAAEA